MFSKDPIKDKPKEIELLRREIKTNLKLSHPLIASMEEFYETEGSIYLIFEILKGTPIISSRTPTLKTAHEVREVIFNLLQALLHLEEQGIVHRDLKPYNILYAKDQHKTKDKTLKLIDFGLAISHGSSNVLYRQCGTPGFIAPEVFTTSRSDFSSILNSKIDIFSVGVIFHFLTFAVYPFGEGESDLIFEKNKKGDFQISPIDEHILDFDDIFGYKLMTEMLSRDPNHRPTISEALKHPYFSTKESLIGTTKIFSTTMKSTKLGPKTLKNSTSTNEKGRFMDKIFNSRTEKEEFGMEEVGNVEEDESEFDIGQMDEGRMMAIRNFGVRSMMPKNKFKDF